MRPVGLRPIASKIVHSYLQYLGASGSILSGNRQLLSTDFIVMA